MRTKSSISLCLVLALTVLLSAFYMPPVQAAGVSPFSDIDESHWGFKSVIKLQCRGVIAGYSDNSYKPNNVISQVEAVILAVRNLAVKSEVEAMADAALPFSVPEWAANNNKKELLYALKIGLLDQSNFTATKAATREWFTRLIVNMCALTKEAATYKDTKTAFKDDADISDEALGAVNVAVKKGIISGYSDGTFLPTKYVTRVEAASILDRCEPYLNLSGSVQVATISNVLGYMLTLQSSKGTQNALLTDSTWGFDEKGKVMNVSNLKAGENIKYVQGNTSIIYAERTTDAVAIINNNNKVADNNGGAVSTYLSGNSSAGDSTNAGTATTAPAPGTNNPQVNNDSWGTAIAVSGVDATVLYVSAEDSLIVVRKDDGSLVTGTVGSTTHITDSSGASMTLSSIPTDAKVSIVASSGGAVSSIMVKSSVVSGSVAKQGTIYRIVPQQKLFMLQTSGGVETYQYTALLDVVIPGITVATVNDLAVGDNVKVTIDSGVMQSVERISGTDGTYTSGEIVLMPAGTDMIIVNVNGERKIYTLANKATVTIPGNASASVNSLKVGDVIRFRITDGAITNIEVQNRLVGADLEGTVKAIDTRDSILVLETSAGITYSYKIKDNARILVDSEEAELRDIEVDDTVSITLFNDEINTITALTGLNGVVTAVDTDRMVMTLADAVTGKTKTYAVDVSPHVHIEGINKATLANVHPGDTVRVEVDNDVIEDIEVERVIAYTVNGIKESTSRIVVVEPSGSSRTLFVKSSVEVIMPDISYPSIYDFEVGDQIDATFLGSTLKKIEVIPSITGQISSVDETNETFVVRTYEGVTKTFNFKSNSLIINDSTHSSKTESRSFSTLEVGDRVIVLANSSGDMTVYRLDKIEGSFVNVLADTAQLRMIASPMVINRTYGLSSKVYLHEGSNTISWNSFNVNDQIAVYLHESQVYEVEKK